MAETAWVCLTVCGAFALGVGVGATALSRTAPDPAPAPTSPPPRYVMPAWRWRQSHPLPTLAERLSRVAELAAGIAACSRAAAVPDPRWLDELGRHQDAITAEAE